MVNPKMVNVGMNAKCACVDFMDTMKCPVHGKGKLGTPTRRWATDESDSQMRIYLDMSGRVTVGDMLAEFAEKYPYVDICDVEINFGSLVWLEEPTEDDLKKRAYAKAWRDKRLAEWEQSTYERLKAKFG